MAQDRPALVQQPECAYWCGGLMAIIPKRPGVITVRAAELKLLMRRPTLKVDE